MVGLPPSPPLACMGEGGGADHWKNLWFLGFFGVFQVFFGFFWIFLGFFGHSYGFSMFLVKIIVFLMFFQCFCLKSLLSYCFFQCFCLKSLLFLWVFNVFATHNWFPIDFSLFLLKMIGFLLLFQCFNKDLMRKCKGNCPGSSRSIFHKFSNKDLIRKCTGNCSGVSRRIFHMFSIRI